MNAPARLIQPHDEVDVIAIALARALARQHHADSLSAGAARENHNDHD